MPQIKFTSPRFIFPAYLIVLALIVFWPVPVDRGLSGTLDTLLGWFHEHGLPRTVGYPEIEFAANVLLFVPLGYLLAVWIGRPWTAFTSAAFVSVVVEFTQSVLLAQRFSTVLDIVANTSGAMIGVMLAVWRTGQRPAQDAASPTAPWSLLISRFSRKSVGAHSQRPQTDDNTLRGTGFKVFTGAAALLAVLGLIAVSSESGPAPASATAEHPTDADETRKPTVAVIGDDTSAGVGAADDYSGWPVRIAIRMDWNVRNFSTPGTGYASSLDGEAALHKCQRERCPSYPEMVDGLERLSPDFVIISGGRNDAWKDPAVVKSEIHRLFRQVTSAVPDARIYVVPPFGDHTALPPELERLAGTIATAAREYGFTVLDIGNPLAGRDSLVVPSGTYPNNDGHRAIADAVEAALNSGLHQ